LQQITGSPDAGTLARMIDKKRLPVHIAIIMDGNGRWAKLRGLPREAGYEAGVETLHKIVESCVKFDIKILTVYAFSTENWNRPRDVVGFLLQLLEDTFSREVQQLHEAGVRVKILGRRAGLPASTREHIEKAEALTAENRRLLLNIGFNYGGRSEIVDACRELAGKCVRGELAPEDIDESLLAAHLTTGGCPDPDLLIRTGGDFRISNFLLWQIAYAELHITPTYWPDFSEEDLLRAIVDYQNRDRRFGKV